MAENALKAKYNGGAVTLGYRIDENKDYQLDPITAPAVREMFEMYASGASMQEIVDNLNALGIRSGQGNMMSINGVTRMLHNRKYIGEYKFKDGVSQSFCNTPISHFYGANITENEIYQVVLLSFG